MSPLKLINMSSKDKLEEKVSYYLDLGWKRYGDMYTKLSPEGSTIYIQSLVISTLPPLPTSTEPDDTHI